MKYIIKEGNCTIVLDSETNSDAIENMLRAIACLIMGVESSGTWLPFSFLMEEVSEKMLAFVMGVRE